jgi:trans-aconitate methyltransferase
MADYDEFEEYYDECVQSGYYDYEKYASDLLESVQDKTSLLELGIGTGLLTEQVLKANLNIDITGVDISSKMLQQAQKRLGTSVQVIESDFFQLNLKDPFDLVYSLGAGFCFNPYKKENVFSFSLGGIELLPDFIEQMAAQVRNEGLFLINKQQAHEYLSIPLKDGKVYEQVIHDTDPHVFTKEYIIREYDQVNMSFKIIYHYLPEDEALLQFKKGGLAYQRMSSNGMFYIFKKENV